MLDFRREKNLYKSCINYLLNSIDRQTLLDIWEFALVFRMSEIRSGRVRKMKHLYAIV